MGQVNHWVHYSRKWDKALWSIREFLEECNVVFANLKFQPRHYLNIHLLYHFHYYFYVFISKMSNFLIFHVKNKLKWNFPFTIENYERHRKVHLRLMLFLSMNTSDRKVLIFGVSPKWGGIKILRSFEVIICINIVEPVLNIYWQNIYL